MRKLKKGYSFIKRMPSKAILTAVLCVFLIMTGCANDQAVNTSDNKDENTQKAIIEMKEVKRNINEIVTPFLDEEGYVKNDSGMLEELSKSVYAYGTKLKQAGQLSDCTICDESKTVAFFYDDETVSLYIPPVKDTYSGLDEEFTVCSVETQKFLEDMITTGVDQFSKFKITGANESAKLIYEKIDSYTSHEKITLSSWKTVDDVVDWMNSFNSNNTRVIIWRGHGSIFTTPDGERLAVWVLPIDQSSENDKYRDDEYSLLFTDTGYAISSNFWKKYCCNVDGGLFLTGSCYVGADGGTAARVFLEKGFSSYAAPNGVIWKTYSDKMLGRITEYLCGNVDNIKYNISDAIKKAQADVGETDIYGTSIIHGNADAANPFMLEKPNRYEAYLKVVEELTKKCGEASKSSYNLFNGLAIVRLIDFDGDGKDELYCVYSDNGFEYYANQQEIYGFVDGKAVSLFKDYVCNQGTSLEPFVEYMSCKDETYLLGSTYSGNTKYGKNWIKIKNNKVLTQFSYKAENTGNEINPAYIYSINNESVSKSEFNSRIEEFSKLGKDNKLFLHAYKNTEVITETKSTIEFLKSQVNDED